MKKLIVGGCSVTHGAETVDGFMHPENVKNSYSRHLAEWLNADLINTALSGGSNDDIFHSLIEEIDRHDSRDIHSVISAWTSVHRLHWTNKNRHWFFIPGWASSMENVYDWTVNQKDNSEVFITSDRKNLLDTLDIQHKFFVDNYLDDREYLTKKLNNYKATLRSYCKVKNIRLIEFDIFSFLDGSTNFRHPTIAEHIDIAKKIYNKFYNDAG